MRTENRTSQHCRKFISCHMTIAERRSNTDLDGLCVALSNAFKFLFCYSKHCLRDGYDRRSFKNSFQQRLVFYQILVCHQCIFKILYPWVICCKEKQQSHLTFLLLFFNSSTFLYLVQDTRVPLEVLFKVRRALIKYFVFEGFVQSSLITLPSMKPLFTPRGWYEVKCVFLLQSPRTKRHQCNDSLILAWYCFVGLGLFQPLPCTCLQQCCFSAQFHPNGFGDNCFH